MMLTIDDLKDSLNIYIQMWKHFQGLPEGFL